MKRTVSLFLCAALLLCGAGALAAEPAVFVTPNSPAASTDDTAAADTDSATDPIDTIAGIEATYLSIWGSIDSVDAANKRLTVTRGGENTSQLVLLISDDTKIVDNVSHAPLDLSALKAGDVIYAWTSRAMTMSLPGQTNAHVIVAGIPMDMQAGQYFEVEKVESVKSGRRLLNQQQDLWATIPADMEIVIFGTDKTLKHKDIQPGTELLIWYDISLESYPAQTTVTNVLAFAYDYDGYVQVDGTAVYANGRKISRKAQQIGGETFVSIRDIASRLGFKQQWNKSAKTLTLTKGATKLTFTAGAETFTANDQEVATQGARMVGSYLYVPLKDLRFLGNYKIANPIR